MITIRTADISDISSIQDIAYRTWPTAYNAIVGEAQVQYMLHNMYNEAVLLSQLEGGHTFLLAAWDTSIVGFAGFSNIDTHNAIFKLHKLYVLPDMHGKGIGKVLLNTVIDQVQNLHATALQLNVNRKNKAKGFYEKCGFKTKETVNIAIGNGFFMEDYVMLLNF